MTSSRSFTAALAAAWAIGVATGIGAAHAPEAAPAPPAELKGDDRNIAVLARAYHGVSLDAVWRDGRFAEP